MVLCMRGFAALMVMTAAGSSLSDTAAADHGPLPSTRPAEEAAGAVVASAFASVGIASEYAAYAAGQTAQAAQTLADDLVERQTAPLPFHEVNNLTDRGFDDTSYLVRLLGRTTTTGVDAAAEEVTEAIESARLLRTALLNKLGLHENPDGPLPYTPAPPSSCVRDVQTALDAAEPGQEVRVCAGRYLGPWVIRQHFVTLLAEAGPFETAVDAQGGNGIVVEASGVTVVGFTVEGATGPATAGILVGTPDNSHTGAVGIAGTLLEGNRLIGNARGILVWKAPATFVMENTIRNSTDAGGARTGVGLWVDEEPGLGLMETFAPDLREDAVGVVAVANNFVDNARHAVRSETGSLATPGAPMLAMFNYFGNPLGANVEVAGTCVGPTAPTGDASCRNGVGQGVIYAGFSPVEVGRGRWAT